MSLLEPTYGVTLTIDGLVISDEAIVIPLGDTLSAYVHNPDGLQRDEKGEPLTDERNRPLTREPGNELAARLLGVSQERDGSMVGTDVTTGQPSRWIIKPGKQCKGC